MRARLPTVCLLSAALVACASPAPVKPRAQTNDRGVPPTVVAAPDAAAPSLTIGARYSAGIRERFSGGRSERYQLDGTKLSWEVALTGKEKRMSGDPRPKTGERELGADEVDALRELIRAHGLDATVEHQRDDGGPSYIELDIRVDIDGTTARRYVKGDHSVEDSPELSDGMALINALRRAAKP